MTNASGAEAAPRGGETGKSLKEQNRWQLWIIVAANSLFLYGVIQANAIRADGLRAALTDAQNLVPVGLALVIATVLNGLGSFGSPNLNPENFALDKGSSDFDIRQRFVTSVLYELPFGKGKRMLGNANRAADLIVGGWQLTSATVFQSGVNRSVTSPNTSTIAFISQRADFTGIPSNSDFSSGGNTIHPGQDFGSANRSLYWFNPNAFSRTAPLTLGTSGRDILSAPGFWNWDMSLFKSFVLTETMNLQFRSEFFNAFNNVRFNPPNMDVSSPFFGQIQSAQPPRILQFSLRLQF